MNLEASHYRARVLKKLRSFFESRGVLEVETPLLSPSCGIDRYIDVFETHRGQDPHRETLYLQTSPELYMKRMLCHDYPSIYQICKAFRLEEKGPLHHPEFTILEWYQLGYDYHALIQEVAEVCQLVLGSCQVNKLSYRDAFQKYLGLDPLDTSVKLLKSKVENRGVGECPFFERTDILNFAISEIIQPRLPQGELTFIVNYPLEQACLAKRDEEDKQVANRFEAFFNGIELCNGFQELADPVENRKRFLEEKELRKEAGQPELVIDELFLKDLEKGLPSCSGVAVGLDRLLMLGFGGKDLKSVGVG